MCFSEALRRLTDETRSIVEASKKTAYDGTVLFVTDGAGHGDALWTRDFGYMSESCSELLGMERVPGCIEYILRAARTDGWVPCSVGTDGEAEYAAGVWGAPAGTAPLDTAAFLTFAADAYLSRAPEAEAKRRFTAWEPALIRALCAVPVSSGGLVVNDAMEPNAPFGLAGGAMKTGSLFMESLLLWRALRKTAALAERFSLFPRDWFILSRRAENIERNISALFEEQSGVFFAADGFCRQPDVWGMLYALDIGFPFPPETERAVAGWLYRNRARYVRRGQICHLPDGVPWERMFRPVPHGSEQNGGYWAAASGWALRFFHGEDPAFAAQMLRELLEDMQRHRFPAWTGPNDSAGPPSAVSAVNVLAGLRRIAAEEGGT